MEKIPPAFTRDEYGTQRCRKGSPGCNIEHPLEDNMTHTPPDEIEKRAIRDYVAQLPDDTNVKIYAYYGKRDGADFATNDLKAAFALSEQSRREDRLREANEVEMVERFLNKVANIPDRTRSNFERNSYLVFKQMKAKISPPMGGQGKE